MFSLESLASVFLFITKESVVILLLALGYWLINRDVFARAFLLLLFSLVLSAFLKSIWQLPLPNPTDTHTWAFPSGHTMATATFWGWLAYEYRNRFFSCVVGLLVLGVGWALVYSGYHYWRDVIGAIGFVAVIIFLYGWVLSWPYFKRVSRQPLIGGGLFLIATAMAYFCLPKYHTPLDQVWLALGALVSISCGWWAQIKCCPEVESWESRFIVVTSCLAGTALLYFLFARTMFLSGLGLVRFSVEYGLIGLWMTVLCQLPVVIFRSR